MKLLIWLIYPVAEAFIQSWLITNKNWKPVYFQLFIIRGFVAIIYGGAVLQVEYDVTETLIWFFWCTASFFAVFNPLLNLLRNKPFDYRGKTSGWLDRVLLKNDVVFYLFYLLTVALAVYCLIKGWGLF